MDTNKKTLTAEELDFLREMANIAAGNTADIFTKLLQSTVNIEIPLVRVIKYAAVASIVDDPSLPVVGVKMKMIGDIEGDIFFIIPGIYKKTLIEKTKWAMFNGLPAKGENSKKKEEQSDELSICAEIGNIVAGAYLKTIYDFCHLKIYQSVPFASEDMLQSLLDETLADLSYKVDNIIVIRNQFILENGQAESFFLLIPSSQSFDLFTRALSAAKSIISGEI